MKRAGLIIVLSLAFFAAELAAITHYQDEITEYIAGFAKSDDWLNDDNPWGWGMSLANRVRRSNREERQVRVYLLGGSTAATFFSQNKMLSRLPGVAVYNLTLPRQNMFEKLMLVDAVQRQATPGLVVLTISRDLPFAQGRFCKTEGVENVIMLSELRDRDFGRAYGAEMRDGPLAGLLSRAVVVVDSAGKVVYTEQVPEIAREPDYEKALAAASKAT